MMKVFVSIDCLKENPSLSIFLREKETPIWIADCTELFDIMQAYASDMCIITECPNAACERDLLKIYSEQTGLAVRSYGTFTIDSLETFLVFGPSNASADRILKLQIQLGLVESNLSNTHLLDFKKGDGLVPVIVQDATSGQVLMLAYMNKEAFDETMRTRRACYYSRSKKRLWRKGEESGNVQLVKKIFIDCDKDTVLLKVEQVGDAACHTGYRSCFYRELVDGEFEVVGERVFDPSEIYNK